MRDVSKICSLQFEAPGCHHDSKIIQTACKPASPLKVSPGSRGPKVSGCRLIRLIRVAFLWFARPLNVALLRVALYWVALLRISLRMAFRLSVLFVWLGDWRGSNHARGGRLRAPPAALGAAQHRDDDGDDNCDDYRPNNAALAAPTARAGTRVAAVAVAGQAAVASRVVESVAVARVAVPITCRIR